METVGGKTKGLLPRKGFPGGSDDKESACNSRRPGLDPWVRKIPWRRKWQSTSESQPEEFHGQSSLMGYSPLGHKESDTTEWLTLSFFSQKYKCFSISRCRMAFLAHRIAHAKAEMKRGWQGSCRKWGCKGRQYSNFWELLIRVKKFKILSLGND